MARLVEGNAILKELNDDLELAGGGAVLANLNEEEEEECGIEGVFCPLSKEDLKVIRDNAALHAKSGRRSKRPSRGVSICEEGKFGSSLLPLVMSTRFNKNQRRSRGGMGRGLPKKGGGGGKGTWGKLGCELELPWVDRNDPNYESDPEDTPTKFHALVPEMGEEDMQKLVEPLILEYFENSDAGEVIYTLQEMLLNIRDHRSMIVSITVELAMEHKSSHRELASVLLSDLYQKVISQRDIGTGYDYLLKQLPDLVFDNPDATDVLGNFIARSIADDCIPPKFLKSYKTCTINDYAVKAIERADALLNMKHGLVRLDNIWGTGGGVRPVKYLVKQIIMLLKEYISSEDIHEATQCLQDLEVPHFHHELVYEATVMVIESMNVHTEEAICKLLQSLFRSFIVTIDQIRNGFERVFDIMPDIAIDVPTAYTVLERFCDRCRKAGFVTDELNRKMPSRGRKRFVSEGDGGRFKEYW
uniref:Programmed cell death protein 4 n=2 Tax=Lepeophtheirus salmonis TaxID=72036 RepID=A0A0K2T795_LEPSM